MEMFAAEKLAVKSVIDPIDLNGGANTGNRIDMQLCKRVTFLITAKAGTSTSSHTASFKQHTVASSGSPLALSVDNPYFHKVDTATVFTKVDSTGTKVSSVDLHPLVASNKFVAIFEVLAEDLTDGYRWVSLDLTQAGGAQIGTVIAVCTPYDKPAYALAL